MIGDAKIRVTMNGKTPTWEIVVLGAVVHRFEGFVDLVDFLAGGTSSARYVDHELPERMRR